MAQYEIINYTFLLIITDFLFLFVLQRGTCATEMTKPSRSLVSSVTKVWSDRWLIHWCIFLVWISNWGGKPRRLDYTCTRKGETTQRSGQHEGCFPISTFSVLSSFPTLRLLGQSWATLVFYFITLCSVETESGLFCLTLFRKPF